MTESKWCRCDEPKLPPPISWYGTLLDIPIKETWCGKCNRQWRKWKNIRGIEIIDYPIGTKFAGAGQDNGDYIYLVRNESNGFITCMRSRVLPYDPNIYSCALREIDVADNNYLAIMMLQDRFEIVEDSE